MTQAEDWKTSMKVFTFTLCKIDFMMRNQILAIILFSTISSKTRVSLIAIWVEWVGAGLDYYFLLNKHLFCITQVLSRVRGDIPFLAKDDLY